MLYYYITGVVPNVFILGMSPKICSKLIIQVILFLTYFGGFAVNTIMIFITYYLYSVAVHNVRRDLVISGVNIALVVVGLSFVLAICDTVLACFYAYAYLEGIYYAARAVSAVYGLWIHRKVAIALKDMNESYLNGNADLLRMKKMIRPYRYYPFVQSVLMFVVMACLALNAFLLDRNHLLIAIYPLLTSSTGIWSYCIYIQSPKDSSDTANEQMQKAFYGAVLPVEEVDIYEEHEEEVDEENEVGADDDQ